MGAVLDQFTPDALDEVLERVRCTGGLQNGALWERLLTSADVSEAVLRKALSDWHAVVSIDDAELARARTAPGSATAVECPGVLVEVDGQVLLVCEDPWSPGAIAALTVNTRPGAMLALARPGQLRTLERLGTRTSAANASAPRLAETIVSPVVEFVEAAITHAYDEGASDIHFETSRHGIAVKFRLDGVMAPGERLEGVSQAEEVVSRIKVMGQLDITERRRPQDGRIHWTHSSGQSIDLRVSVMPSIFGEDAVLRLLDKAQLRQGQTGISLDSLGFESGAMRSIRSLASRPHGMLLVTGPTGSGKTTTLYAALSEVNDGLEKIITIEDPVEYELPGVLQIPVNEKKGLTFANGLRSILRHDPDKILVGEIRDAETAEIAVQSSLTGHTVFTTVHANSVFDVLGRFQHFGIDPFALASALNGIVVQRLLRRVCHHCLSHRCASADEQRWFDALGWGPVQSLPVAIGCDHCRASGYRGRLVLAEVHELSDQIRDLIVNKCSMSELKKAVYVEAGNRLSVAALRKVQDGLTTVEEVRRVVGME
jgi:general secretion pathway protein E